VQYKKYLVSEIFWIKFSIDFLEKVLEKGTTALKATKPTHFKQDTLYIFYYRHIRVLKEFRGLLVIQDGSQRALAIPNVF